MHTLRHTVGKQAGFTETASATAEVMTLLLASIAGVSFRAGGIGSMNIMLVSVLLSFRTSLTTALKYQERPVTSLPLPDICRDSYRCS